MNPSLELISVFGAMKEIHGSSPGIEDLFSKFYDLFAPVDQLEDATGFETTEGVFHRMMEIYPSSDLTMDKVYFFLNAAGYSLKNMSDSGIEMRWLLKSS